MLLFDNSCLLTRNEIGFCSGFVKFGKYFFTIMEKTLGIVIHTIKYSESSVITKVFTRNLGYKSFIIKGIRSKKSKKMGLLQPFTILEMDVRFTNKSNLGWVKEMNVNVPIHAIRMNVVKNSLVMFLSELLYRTLEEDYQDINLFDFAKDAIVCLETESQVANFHLWFMLELSKIYGFYPNENYSLINPYFNLVSGHFESRRKKNSHWLSEESSLVLQKFLGIIFAKAMMIDIRSKERKNLLDSLIVYFQLHVEGMKKMKSQEILNTIFS